MTIPNNFGHIYLGEAFRGVVNLNNEAEEDVTQVTLKVELHTTSQRFSLEQLSIPSEVCNHLADAIILLRRGENHAFFVINGKTS